MSRVATDDDPDAGPLRLLRRDGEQSTGVLVCPPGCADLAPMAVATGSSERLHLDAFDGIPEAAPAATAQDHPSLHRRARSSLLKNRMREICTSGSVRAGDGNIPAYSAQRVGAQPELAGVVGHDHELTQQPVMADRAPQRALGGDRDRRWGYAQGVDPALSQVRPPVRLV